MVALQQCSIDAIGGQEDALLAVWLDASPGHHVRLSRQECETDAAGVPHLLAASLKDAGRHLDSTESGEVRRFLDNFLPDRATRRFDSRDAANFIFSLKPVLPALVPREYASTLQDLGQQSGSGQGRGWARHHLARLIRSDGPVCCLVRHVPPAHRDGQRYADLR